MTWRSWLNLKALECKQPKMTAKWIIETERELKRARVISHAKR